MYMDLIVATFQSCPYGSRAELTSHGHPQYRKQQMPFLMAARKDADDCSWSSLCPFAAADRLPVLSPIQIHSCILCVYVRGML